MDLPTDIWDIVFQQFSPADLKKVGIINKNSTDSLLRIKWKRLNISELSDPFLLDKIFTCGVFQYSRYVEELSISLRKRVVSDLAWMRHLHNLKRITIHSNEDFYKDITIDADIAQFLSLIFLQNKKLWNVTAGCKMLEILKLKENVTAITLCCEWTRNSAKVVASFPNLRELTLRKKIKHFDYFSTIPQVENLYINSSWLDQESLHKLSKVFPRISKLNIEHVWGNHPFDFNDFDHLVDLEICHMNVQRYPPNLRYLKSWSTKIEYLEMVPIYTLEELHMSLYVGHVFDFLDPSFEFLPSLILTMLNLNYFSFSFVDGQSQLIISNALDRYCSAFVRMKDLNIMTVNKDLKFAVLVDDSIPAFIEYIGERMLSILISSNIITQSTREKHISFLKSLFPSYMDAKDKAVLRDIDEYYRRINSRIIV
eukprot:NODE_168_length_16247_cov_0.199591.p3 type:complete len:426 gc:universal NODE_168_length_16247_cov_0.199591:4187-2910(-)